MTRIEAEKLAAVRRDAASTTRAYGQMSRNPVIVAAGKATFNANCVACHKASLRGKCETGGIGADLTARSGSTAGIRPTFTARSRRACPSRGCRPGARAWAEEITEVVAYVLSHHKEGEPMIIDAADPGPAK